MNFPAMKRWMPVAALLPGLLLSGCQAPRIQEEQVARAAKDWCLTIRGSQVLPVYPLTEDLLPGDVFLVQTPIQAEQKQYQAAGFLPLPEHLTRLHPAGVEQFYRASHGTKGAFQPPYGWRFDATNGPGNQHLMPRAGFPNYRFSTRRGLGVNVAVPISGIPVAMNLVGSSSVDGSVVLSDAYTYAVDRVALQDQLVQWAEVNRALLEAFAPTYATTNYLRVVNRIYLVGGVEVQVTATRTAAGGVSGGAEKPVNLLSFFSTNAFVNYTNALAALSSSLSTAVSAPGGSLKLASASAGSVSLKETFPRPLVVGYLGFDIPISTNGTLGIPLDTRVRLLAQKPSGPVEGVLSTSVDVNTVLLRNWLRSDPQNDTKAKEWLKAEAGRRKGPQANLANVLTALEYKELRAQLVEALVPPLNLP